MTGPLLLCAILLRAAAEQPARAPREPFLSWSEKQALEIGKSVRANGRVGGWLDRRVLHTERSYNYKLRATWLTPEAIRASARLHQIENGLDDEETLALVREAELQGDAIVLVEIDPREGSGIIPREWIALLRAKSDGDSAPAVRGVSLPELRKVKALSGIGGRDYAYDVFWVVFPLVTSGGAPLFDDEVREAELVVRIQGKEGRVSWPIPESIRERSREISRQHPK